MSQKPTVIEPEVLPVGAGVPVDPRAPRRVQASAKEIVVAAMLAHGALNKDIAKRIGRGRGVIAKLRGRAAVKRLVAEYQQDPGLAGLDLIEAQLQKAVLVLVDAMDKGKRDQKMDAAKALLKLGIELRKRPISWLQMNMFSGGTALAAAAEVPDEELYAEAKAAAERLGLPMRRDP